MLCPNNPNFPKLNKNIARGLRYLICLCLILLQLWLAYPLYLRAEDLEEETNSPSSAESAQSPQPLDNTETPPTSPQDTAGTEEGETANSSPANDPLNLPQGEPQNADGETQAESGAETETPEEAAESETSALPLPQEEPSQPEATSSVEFSTIPGRCSIILALEENSVVSWERARLLNFNPYLISSSSLTALSNLLYRPLYRGDKPELSLLENSNFDEKSKELSLLLKEDLHWADGKIISSRDVLYTLASLLKNPDLHPASQILGKLEDSSKLLPISAEENREQEDAAAELPDMSVVGARPQPFPEFSGIECLNDRELKLRFKESPSKAELIALLSLKILPSQAWWPSEALDWPLLEQLPALSTHPENPDTLDEETLERQNFQAAYCAASAALYVQDFAENSQDWNFKAQPDYLKSLDQMEALSRSRLTIRPQVASTAVAEVLKSKANLGIFARLSETERQVLTEGGYKLETLGSPEIISLSFNLEMEDDPFISTALAEFLPSLLPSAESLNEGASLQVMDLQAPEDFNPDEFWQALVQAAYYSEKMPENYRQEALEKGATALPQLELVYELGDELCQRLAQNLEQKLAELGIYPRLYGLSSSDLDFNKDSANFAQVILQSQNKSTALGKGVKPLYQKLYYIASQGISEVENILLFD